MQKLRSALQNVVIACYFLLSTLGNSLVVLAFCVLFSHTFFSSEVSISVNDFCCTVHKYDFCDY
jgi:hypothetical protein